MEQIGVFLDEEWESLSKVFTFEEAQLNNWSFENLSNSWSIFDENTNMNVNEGQFNSFNAFVSNFHSFSQESGNNNGGFSQSLESNNIIDPVVFSINEIEDKSKSSLDTYFSDDYMGEIFSANEDILINMLGNENGQLKRKLTMPPLMNCSQDMTNTESFSITSKKKPRVSVDKISKKNKKITSNSDACSYDSMIKEGNKGRASGGVAESQSVYARKRREKINERLKTLQKLVPSGTKVDISTMLDEAVHYVKFLQLQIKLLSSDDKWMYAPIAYNGMDSGIYSV